MVAPSVSARFTDWPDSTVLVAVSVDNPFPPVGTVAVTNPGGAVAPLMLRWAVSPVTPVTHCFCRVSVADVRVLVTAQSAGTGSVGDLIGAALSTRAGGEAVRGCAGDR